MNYQKIYMSLIENAKNRNLNSIYYEKHHIIPKCLGGTNDKTNIVKLTYREHFLCHWILCKIYKNNHRLLAAFNKMLEKNKNNSRIITSKHFDIVKKTTKNTHYYWLKNKEPWNKGKTGVQVAWNKGKKLKPHTEEFKEKVSATLKNKYKTEEHHRKNKEPWNKGKTGVQVAWNKGKQTPLFTCIHCSKIVGGENNLKRWHGDNCKLRIA
jgi:hypothetical protein